MIVIRGNLGKSPFTLDVDFDEVVIVNTLTQVSKSFEDLVPSSRGMYSKCLLDFTDLELGEYKYYALSSGSTVQTGLLQIVPFEEEDEVVQYITPTLSRSIVTYQN